MKIYAGHEVQFLEWGLWMIAVGCSLIQPTLMIFCVMESFCEGMGLAYLTFQMGAEDLHMGGMSATHHLNSLLWIIVLVCHSYWQLLSDQSASASSILATAQK